jgi:hypothetical protein
VYNYVRGRSLRDFPSFDDGLRSAIITEAVLEAARDQKWVHLP